MQRRLFGSLALLACILLSPYKASAELTRLPSSKGLPPARGVNGTWLVAVVNTLDSRVRFVIREPGMNWVPQVHEAGEKAVYRCTRCNGEFELGISTKGREVRKAIRAGGLYGINFNPRSRRYDVSEIE